MNINLQYSMNFIGGIYYDGSLQFNNYEISLQMITASTDALVTSIALERIKVFVHDELEHVIFINRSSEAQAQLLQAIGGNVCTLPEEPVDQIIGMMLYCKLNAITEGRLLVTKLDIASSLGDNVWFQHEEEDNLGPFAQDGWWHKNNCEKDDLDTPTDTDKVVKVDHSGWHEHGLGWPEDKKEQKAKIVYPDFRKHETK